MLRVFSCDDYDVVDCTIFQSSVLDAPFRTSLRRAYAKGTPPLSIDAAWPQWRSDSGKEQSTQAELIDCGGAFSRAVLYLSNA